MENFEDLNLEQLGEKMKDLTDMLNAARVAM